MNILHIKRGNTRFEDQDTELLRQFFDTRTFEPTAKKMLLALQEIRRCEVIFYWFPNDYKLLLSLIGKLLGKKIFVIAGGQMSTGDTRSNRRKAGVKYRPFFIIGGILCLRLADKIIAVSKYEKQGLMRYVPLERIQLLYNTYRTDLFRYRQQQRNHRLIVTVSAVNQIYFKRKGLDRFIETAANLPNYHFVIIGKDHEDGTSAKIKNLNLPNLELAGFIDDNRLVLYLQQASVYCQLSRQEGFGVALAEAIACGAIPVVSRNGAIPEVAGPQAFYVEEEDAGPQIAQIIRNASAATVQFRASMAQRIEESFGNSDRANELVKMFQSL
jgi:glycosyltransferase involved in cell wall biosynthesis